MKAGNITLNLLKKTDKIPFDLLLMADESKKAIEKYIYSSDIYIAFVENPANPIGVFALQKISQTEVEIKNIAVHESFRSKGIGSFLISRIKQIALRKNYKEVIVGTSDTGIMQIQFYERNGFKKYDIKRNFFIENYDHPIMEDGILLKDMIMMKTRVC